MWNHVSRKGLLKSMPFRSLVNETWTRCCHLVIARCHLDLSSLLLSYVIIDLASQLILSIGHGIRFVYNMSLPLFFSSQSLLRKSSFYSFIALSRKRSPCGSFCRSPC